MKIKSLITTILLASAFVFAGESQFGLVNNGIGNVKLPLSASGLARSYEIANSDSVQLNFRNFATWTNISQTTLSLSLGYQGFWGENRVKKNFTDNANFEGVFLAIPLMQKELVFGAGLLPYTSIEQRLETVSTQNGEKVTENNYINGGASRTNFNLVYKAMPNLSVGIGYEYTFGKITEDVRLSIDNDLNSVIDFDSERQISGNGLVLSLFHQPLENFNIGLVFRPSLSGEIVQSAESPSNALNTEKTYDVTLPAEYNIGLEYALSPAYVMGFDMVWQDWKKGYKIDDKSVAQHSNYYHVGFGIEKKGSSRKFVKYREQLDLRAGLFYNQLSTLNNGKKVNEYGVSMGISLPIQRFKSKLDIAAYIARRGSLSENVLQETIMGISFSVSANELWFVNLED